jgi:hypothetical protein
METSKSRKFYNRFMTQSGSSLIRDKMKEQRLVETVEDFKLRIAASTHARPDEIPSPRRPRSGQSAGAQTNLSTVHAFESGTTESRRSNFHRPFSFNTGLFSL